MSEIIEIKKSNEFINDDMVGFYVVTGDTPVEEWRWNSGELITPNIDGPYATEAIAESEIIQ